MVKPLLRNLPTLAVFLTLASCATPTVEEAVAPAVAKKEAPKVEAEEPLTDIPQPDLPPMPDDEIRLPPMLNLPTDNEFQASNPLLPRNGPSSGGVIVRPPTDPPSRVKPEDKAADGDDTKPEE